MSTGCKAAVWKMQTDQTCQSALSTDVVATYGFIFVIDAIDAIDAISAADCKAADCKAADCTAVDRFHQ